jgi:antitoxin (DNA-binding transcriptional repressor) of toxin-antitoxin stability system
MSHILQGLAKYNGDSIELTYKYTLKYTYKMDNILGIKELQLNLKRVADAAQKGASFIIVRDSKPVFRIEPIKNSGRSGTLEDSYKLLHFKGGKNLSKEIDEILYGKNAR